MNIEEIVQRFQDNPKRAEMGAGKLSKWFKCSREDIYKAREIFKQGTATQSNFPKILIFDLETAPLKAYVWQRWKQNIYGSQLLSDWFILTWSAKWLGSSTVMSAKLTPEEVMDEDDSRILSKLWKLMDQADIVIAHNGDKFDIKMMNGRFLVQGMQPPSHYRTIDTLKVAQKHFRFNSNSLNELGKILGLGQKLETSFELWAKCLEGDEEALTYMQEYNDQDVILLEEVYLKLRPYMRSHPNVAIYIEDSIPRCSHCGSDKVKPTGKFFYTNVAKYPTYVCKCGAESRGRVSEVIKEARPTLLCSTGK